MCSESVLRAISCAKSCLGSAIGARLGEDATPSMALSRGDAECMLLGVRLLLVAGVEAIVGWYCDMPAEMATLVWRHLRKGEVWMTTLCFLLFLFLLPSPFCLEPRPSGADESFVASFKECSRACSKLAMRTPSARHCVQPPYVRGGS